MYVLKRRVPVVGIGGPLLAPLYLYYNVTVQALEGAEIPGPLGLGPGLGEKKKTCSLNSK